MNWLSKRVRLVGALCALHIGCASAARPNYRDVPLPPSERVPQKSDPATAGYSVQPGGWAPGELLVLQGEFADAKALDVMFRFAGAVPVPANRVDPSRATVVVPQAATPGPCSATLAGNVVWRTTCGKAATTSGERAPLPHERGYRPMSSSVRRGEDMVFSGDFSNVAKAHQIKVRFAGHQDAVVRLLDGSSHVVAQVPQEAMTGECSLLIDGKIVWRGHCAVD